MALVELAVAVASTGIPLALRAGSVVVVPWAKERGAETTGQEMVVERLVEMAPLEEEVLVEAEWTVVVEVAQRVEAAVAVERAVVVMVVAKKAVAVVPVAIPKDWREDVAVVVERAAVGYWEAVTKAEVALEEAEKVEVAAE